MHVESTANEGELRSLTANEIAFVAGASDDLGHVFGQAALAALEMPCQTLECRMGINLRGSMYVL